MLLGDSSFEAKVTLITFALEKEPTVRLPLLPSVMAKPQSFRLAVSAYTDSP
jgi:hypothetical protein